MLQMWFARLVAPFGETSIKAYSFDGFLDLVAYGVLNNQLVTLVCRLSAFQYSQAQSDKAEYLRLEGEAFTHKVLKEWPHGARLYLPPSPEERKQKMEEQQQTRKIGASRVGVSFNPSGKPIVDEIKAACADLIDMVASIGDPAVTPNPEIERVKAIAMTKIEEAAMWAVKAATKG